MPVNTLREKPLNRDTEKSQKVHSFGQWTAYMMAKNPIWQLSSHKIAKKQNFENRYITFVELHSST